MLYHLLAPLGKQHLIFNLFNYISFRAGAATVTALLLAFVVGPGHHPPAAGAQGRPGHPGRGSGVATRASAARPTMGGVIILIATIVPTLLWAQLSNRFVIVAMLATLWMGAIGFLDDYLKIVQGQVARPGGAVEAGGAVQLRARARPAT